MFSWKQTMLLIASLTVSTTRGFVIGSNSVIRHCQTRLFASSPNIAIVGGGLAGLGLAHALLEKEPSVSICIYDKSANVGQGGASAVAGGLLHPLSPRGKLVHWGKEGIESTSRLVMAAAKHVPRCILREHLYRVAMTDRNVEQLTATVAMKGVSDYCEWLDKEEMDTILGSTSTLGGLKLSNGCRVIHVPSYLEGLYAVCQELGDVKWRAPLDDMSTLADKHDIVVWAGGSGMIQDGVFDKDRVPVTLVRGQSVELKPNVATIPREAALSGKYISPLPDDRMLVGATHEFKEMALSQNDFIQELKEKSYHLSPNLWDNATIDRVTCGYRVQSQRGALGRLPIVGHLQDNQWVFTGLSSRGLLYHGIYGETLADMILSNDESVLAENSHLDWWRRFLVDGKVA